MSPPFITRLRLRNYKSIASCDVSLGPLTILVGPNGSGKSNLLDALAFLGQAVSFSPEFALGNRGGLGQVLRRVPNTTDYLSVNVQLSTGSYGFEIRSTDRHSFEVVREEGDLDGESFRVQRGRIQGGGDQQIEPDRLYLPLVSARPEFAPLKRILGGMAFYDFDPGTLGQVALPSLSARLGPRGEHLADVLGAMSHDRFDAYMAAIVPGFRGLYRKTEGQYVTVELLVAAGNGAKSAAFGPPGISHGTLRAAGVLAALFQPNAREEISLVGLEEPESTLHPGGAGALFDALSEASQRVQVIVTSHSGDLLDRDDIDPEIIRAVTMEDGLTIVGEVDEDGKKILRDRLFTIGEMLRAGQLFPGRFDGAEG